MGEHLLAQEHGLRLLVDFDLVIHCFYAFVYRLVRRVLEIARRLVEALNYRLNGLLLQFRPLLEVQEVQPDDLVEVL